MSLIIEMTNYPSQNSIASFLRSFSNRKEDVSNTPWECPVIIKEVNLHTLKGTHNYVQVYLLIKMYLFFNHSLGQAIAAI